MTIPLVLASTSPYRKALLERIGLAFVTAAPEVDERPLPNETPQLTAERLSIAKARAMATHYPDALIIGSDQVAECEGRAFGKPGTRERNIEQLKAMSGKDIVFHTGLCLLNATSGAIRSTLVPTTVSFRHLTDTEIESYVSREDATNCAGGAKAEGLGIALLHHIRGDDPNALIGLPLIALCEMLRAEGVAVP